MKRLLLLNVMLLLIFPAAFAYHANAVFTSKHGEPFQLFVNGRLINRAASNYVRLDNFPTGRHEVEIRMRDYLHVSGFRTDIYLFDGFETHYEIKQNGRNGKIHFREISKVPLVAPVLPPHHGYQPIPDDYYKYPDYPQQPAPQTCANLLEQYAIDHLVQSINKQSFESSKITIAKQAVSGGNVLAEDVKRIMGLFTYESTRVDFAKFAYVYTCDKQNYFIVNDAFEYSSSINELNRYIRK